MQTNRPPLHKAGKDRWYGGACSRRFILNIYSYFSLYPLPI